MHMPGDWYMMIDCLPAGVATHIHTCTYMHLGCGDWCSSDMVICGEDRLVQDETTG